MAVRERGQISLVGKAASPGGRRLNSWEDSGGVTLAGGALAAPSELLAPLPFVAFGTGAVEVALHAVARGPVLAGVGLAGVRPAGNLLKSGRRARVRTG